MLTFAEAGELVADAMTKGVKWLEKEPDNLYVPMRYILQQGGKRLRPSLAVMCASMFQDPSDKSFMQATVFPCMAVEVFHNFTLIHDDIMDHSDMRRGKPTVVNKFGENAAILSGDSMLLEAYRILALAPAACQAYVFASFTHMALELCEGQQEDMDFERRDDVSLPEYMEMIRKKTAILIGESAYLGALVGGSEYEEAKTLYDFGVELGIAFQVMDDYLDLYGDERTFGKKIGGDIREGKKTYLYLRALQELGKSREAHSLRRWMNSHGIEDNEKITAIRDIYDKINMPQMVEEEMNRHYQQALRNVKTLQAGRKWNDSQVTPLVELATTMANRKN